MERTPLNNLIISHILLLIKKGCVFYVQRNYP
nr:MAG TPA: hypothetical protein [Caudoviricetes sp.]